MKVGRSLSDMAVEIERQMASKRDFVAPAQKIRAAVDESTGNVLMRVHNGNDPKQLGPVLIEGPVKSTAHRQLSDYLDIPAKYYDRMLEKKPDMLVRDVNGWLDDMGNSKQPNRMCRMLDGGFRAFLSDKFPLDMENVDMLTAVMPVIRELSLQVVSCDVTETRMYLKAVDLSVIEQMPQGEWGRGHTIRRMREASPAVTLSNSEIGFGSWSLETGLYDSHCTNLASFGGRLVKRQHIGARHQLVDGSSELLSAATKRKISEALIGEMRDVLRGSVGKLQFQQRIQSLVETQQQAITGDVPKVVEVTAKQLGLNDTERASVLRHLIGDGDELNRFALYNAITRTAEDVESYDRATQLERLGGKLIELPATEWNSIAEAA